MNNPHDINLLIKELENLKRSKQKIMVEGKFDKDALEDLGMGNIFVLHKIGRSLSSGIEQFIANLKKGERIVILTDFDKHGEEYYKILKEELTKNGFKINNNLRRILRDMKISHIEGLSSFLEREAGNKQ